MDLGKNLGIIKNFNEKNGSKWDLFRRKQKFQIRIIINNKIKRYIG